MSSSGERVDGFGSVIVTTYSEVETTAAQNSNALQGVQDKDQRQNRTDDVERSSRSKSSRDVEDQVENETND